MSTTGRAAVFTAVRSPFEIREYPVPDPGSRDLLIQILRTNICGSDLHIWRGDTDLKSMGLSYGVILGHEMVGRIYKLGKDVDSDSLNRPVREGDRVVYTYYLPCGHCRECLMGEVHRCMVALATPIRPCDDPPHFVGGFADYYYLKGRQYFLKVPDELPDPLVAGLNCALCQVIYGLDVVQLKLGETVVVQGAGGLGVLACAVAREMGAHRVIAIDAIPFRLELARKFGADTVIPVKEYPDPRQRVEKVMEYTEGYGADVVVEVVGFPDVIPEGIRMLSRGGRYLEMGNINPRHTYKADPSLLVGFNRSIHGVSLYPPYTLKRALDFLLRTKDRYPYDLLYGKTFPLEEITHAFEEADAFSQTPKGIGRLGIVP